MKGHFSPFVVSIGEQVFQLRDQEVQRAAAFQARFEDLVAVVGDPGIERLAVVLLIAGTEDADQFGAVGVLG